MSSNSVWAVEDGGTPDGRRSADFNFDFSPVDGTCLAEMGDKDRDLACLLLDALGVVDPVELDRTGLLVPDIRGCIDELPD